MDKGQELERDNWILSSIEIKLQTYGSDKGRYTGYIRFSNGEAESLNLKIDAESSAKYMGLISEQIIHTTEILADRVRKSIILKENEQENTSL